MKNFLRFPIFIAICGLLIGSAAMTTNKTSAASAAVDNLSPATKHELTRARNGTACNFDIEHPEALHYIPEGNNLRLVGVEYVIPVACTATAPEGFTGDDDEWEFMAEGLPIWATRAAIWLPNENGMFAEDNPAIPDVCP